MIQTTGSEKTKLYIVIVLALIAAVVAYFRFVHKGGGTAAKIAPAPPPKAQQLDLASVKTPDSLKPRALRRPVAEPLDKDIRDIFAPPQLPKKPELPAPTKPSAPTNPAGKAPVVSPPAPPPLNVELRGVVVGGNEPLAIINDKFVRLGEKVGDYEVVEITATTVHLRAGKHRKVIQVLKPSQK